MSSKCEKQSECIWEKLDLETFPCDDCLEGSRFERKLSINLLSNDELIELAKQNPPKSGISFAPRYHEELL